MSKLSREQRRKKAMNLYEKYRDMLVVRRCLGHKKISSTLDFVVCSERNVNKAEEL